MKCRICGRETSEDDYCELHAKALKNLKEKYHQWKRALEISWKDYLSEIAENPFTGEWVREVAQHQIRRGSDKNVTES